MVATLQRNGENERQQGEVKGGARGEENKDRRKRLEFRRGEMRGVSGC